MRPFLAIATAALTIAAAPGADPLPSWNDTPTKAAIAEFAEDADVEDSGGFVPDEQRIAVFDNDGTLWAEQPYYFQLMFLLDRAKALAAADPNWADAPALRAAAAGDLQSLMAGGDKALLELAGATQSGMSVEAFEREVANWLETARHPVTGRLIRDMTYQPMRELLDLLRANGFRVYIVSGGGVDFMRAFAQQAYGVSPENVIGSFGDAAYGTADGKPAVIKGRAVAFIDDKEGKPVGIMRHIGRRPVFVAGNSDGDYQMAEWSTAGGGPRMAIFIHHTDAAREFAYDRKSPVGALDRALDAAASHGWIVVDMQADWNRIWAN